MTNDFLAAAKELSQTLYDPIGWTGDLNDDCVARWRGMSAHVEAMNHGKRDGEHEWWYFAVCREGEDDIVHSMRDDISAATGEAARKLCEMFMRFEAIKGR